MSTDRTTACIAFSGSTCIASGPAAEVACAVKQFLDSSPDATVLVFDADTSEPVEFDLRGTAEQIVARMPVPEGEAAPDTPRSPGRPKLGVVAREVTLLPRHWEWLASQPGGASVTLRKLVETARKNTTGEDRVRRSQEAAYRFANAVAGNEPGFEESIRALYAGDRERFEHITQSWPEDVRAHARAVAADAWPAGAQGGE
jgi:uncharacterized protein